jgi:type I restriction enzyme, S subunit
LKSKFEFKNNLKTFKVKDIGTVITGKTPSTKNLKYFGNKIPFLTPSDISDSKFVKKTVRCLSQEGEKLLKKYVLPIDSIAVSCIGTVGKIVKICEPTITNQQFNSIIPNEKVNSEYLYYHFTTLQNSLENLAGGGTVLPIIKKSLFEEIELLLPPKSVQDSIAPTLSSLDSLRNSLDLQNQVLEKIIQSIFKLWFVDFDGVTEFDDSELGQIPKRWKVNALHSIGKITTGKTPSTKEKSNFGNKYPFITIPDIHDSLWTTKTKRHLSEKGKNVIENYLLPEYSVCVSCIATPGLVALTTRDSFSNQQINSIICKHGISPFFVYSSLKMQRKKIIQLASGGTVTPNLNKGDFSLIKIILPPIDLMNDYHNLMSPAFETIRKNTFKMEQLEKIRDTIILK